MRAAITACRVAGTLTSATSVWQTKPPLGSLEHSAFGEVADHLLRKKWITGSSRHDRFGPPR